MIPRDPSAHVGELPPNVPRRSGFVPPSGLPEPAEGSAHATAVGLPSHLDWQSDGRAEAGEPDPAGPGPLSDAELAAASGQAVAQSTAIPAGEQAPGQSLAPRAAGPAAYELDGPVRTALSVEVRDGRLCVFLPPVETLEQYLDLLREAEASTSSASRPTPA